MELLDKSKPKLLTVAEAPFDLLQELLNSKDPEQLWNYVKLLDEDGTGVNRVCSIQLFVKANGGEETNAWKKLVADEAPLGMAGSKFCSCFCHGNINISCHKVTLKEDYNHLCAMIALPVNSFLPCHHQAEYQADTVRPFRLTLFPPSTSPCMTTKPKSLPRKPRR